MSERQCCSANEVAFHWFFSFETRLSVNKKLLSTGGRSVKICRRFRVCKIWEILGGLGNPFWAASEEAIECLIEFKELDLTIMLDWLHSFIEVKA